MWQRRKQGCCRILTDTSKKQETKLQTTQKWRKIDSKAKTRFKRKFRDEGSSNLDNKNDLILSDDILQDAERESEETQDKVSDDINENNFVLVKFKENN